MEPAHVVTIVAVAAAVVVVALFLIAIVVELTRTHRRLITILQAVSDTVENTNGLEAIVGEINEDLAGGRAALADCVDRLEQRLGGRGNGASPEGTESLSRTDVMSGR